MSKRQYMIELPAAVGRRVHRTARKQRRKPSEIAVEAIEQYFTLSRIPEETPTAAELRAIRQGEAAIKRGDYITLDELRRKKEVARRPRRARAKVS
jgi:predicted transcriptional regulator